MFYILGKNFILGMQNPNMLTCTLGIIIISILENTLHLKKLHIFIAIVCHILYLKRVIESIPYHNTKGMFHILGKHIILELINLQMLNAFTA